MKRLALLTLIFCASCNSNLVVDPEGLRCDPGEVCPAGYLCARGVCRNQFTCPEGVCACEQPCTSPPPAQCQSASILRRFAPSGTCQVAEGTCRYEPLDTLCDSGCVEGACVQDGCLGKLCVEVPNATCVDGSTLRTFSGVCQSGNCGYPAKDTQCLNGCLSGQCKNEDLCAGILCNSPPAGGCSAGKARTYSPVGSCAPGTGTCSYEYNETACTFGCVSGVCVGPSLGFSQTGPKIRHAVSAVDQAPGSFGGHVLAVGPSGAATRYASGTWSTLQTPTTADLNSVWLGSTSSGWVVGAGKVLLRYDGSTLSAATLTGGPSSAKLVAVHGRNDNHVLVADEAGNFWRYNGASWTAGSLPSANGPYVISSAYVDEGDHERIAGRCGSKSCVAYASGPSATYWVDLDSSSEGFRSIGPSVDAASANLAFAGHQLSATVRRHKTFTSPYFDSTNVPVSLAGGGILGISPAATSLGQAVYLLTGPDGPQPGQLYRYTSAGVLDPSSPLLDLWGTSQSLSRTDSGGVMVADSRASSASLFRRGVVTNQVMDLGEDWQAAAFGAAGSLVLMNQDGDLATRPAVGGFTFRRSPTSKMYAMEMGTTFALIAGAGGEAYRVGASYGALSTNTSATLRAICRVSDLEWYLVGDGGVLRGSDGVSVSSASSPTSRNLLDVFCAGSRQAVAVGEGGTVLRLSGLNWQAVSPAFPDGTARLTSVAQSAAGTVYVAGDGIFAKLEGGAWFTLPSKPGLEELQVLGPNDIYAIANGNQVVRFDGTAWSTKFTSTDTLLAGASSPGKVVFAGRSGVLVEGQ